MAIFIDNKGLVAVEFKKKAFISEEIGFFLYQASIKLMENKKEVVDGFIIVMDNSNCNRSERMTDYIKNLPV